MKDIDNEKLSEKQGDEDGSWLPEYSENASSSSRYLSKYIHLFCFASVDAFGAVQEVAFS